MTSLPEENARESGRRLAIYIPSLRGGGAERMMVKLANGFSDRGYAVDLVLVSAKGPYLVEISKNVRVVDLKARRVITSIPGLISYLRRSRPEALLSAMSHTNVIAVLVSQLTGMPIRVVVSHHNVFSASSANAESWRERFALKYFIRYAYSRANAIVAISNGVADDLAKSIALNRERIEVIYNPVVDDYLLALSNEAATQPWLEFGADPLILGVGRLTQTKDFITLIRAFAKVRADRKARLVILGEGDMREVLEAEVARLRLYNDVFLPGFVTNPFAPMCRADLFVLSSAHEGFGNVIVEAMACGLPVVSTDCPVGPSEILENGKWGHLVPAGNVEAMAKAMITTLDKAVQPDVSSRANYFSLSRAVEGYLKVLFPKSKK